MKNEMQTTNNELREIRRPELAKQILNSNWKTETWMTRALLAFGIVLLFSLPARAQQPAPADNGQQSNKPPVQPGQTAAPAQAPNLSPPPSPTPAPAAPAPWGGGNAQPLPALLANGGARIPAPDDAVVSAKPPKLPQGL